MSELLPKVSIITVVYNCKDSILSTINSVNSLDYSNKEYIIVDGQSHDGTIEVIERNINPDVVFICEHDDGIYDAMNKALKIATGEWTIFMNAGDVFSDSNVLSKVFTQKTYSDNIGIIYGDCLLKFAGNKMIKKSFSGINLDNNHANFCHQSIFTRTDLAQKHPFNTNYHIIADYIMVDEILNSGYSSSYINMIISIYDMSGISSKHELELFKEKARYNNIRDIKYILKYCKAWGKTAMFSLFGEKFMNFMIYYKLKNR